MKASFHLPDLDCRLIFKSCKIYIARLSDDILAWRPCPHFQKESNKVIANRLEPSFWILALLLFSR